MAKGSTWTQYFSTIKKKISSLLYMARFPSRKLARKVYKATGYQNPMKKGKLSSSRVMKQIPRMLTDLSMLKAMVNAEKKRIITSSTNQLVAQVSGAAGSGHYIVDVTPNPTQGAGFNQKSGSSIKWHSSHYDFQVIGQASCVAGVTLKMEWVQVTGLPYSTLNDIFGKYILANQFISGGATYDINSNRDPDYFKNFKVLKKQYVTLRPDVITGDVPVKQLSLGLKLKNHHVRNNDNDPTLSMGQVFLLITANTGNWGSVASTLTGVSNATPLTGASFSYIRTDYFYDN